MIFQMDIPPLMALTRKFDFAIVGGKESEALRDKVTEKSCVAPVCGFTGQILDWVKRWV